MLIKNARHRRYLEVRRYKLEKTSKIPKFDFLIFTDKLKVLANSKTSLKSLDCFANLILTCNSLSAFFFQLDQNNAGLIRRIISYSNKNPWLYAVYVVVIGLPLVLVITFCCSGSSGADSKKSDPKKTDEVQADDREDEDAAGNVLGQ